MCNIIYIYVCIIRMYVCVYIIIYNITHVISSLFFPEYLTKSKSG